MNLPEFSRINRERCESAQGFNQPLSSWSPAEWTNATLGELGEAANLTKKISRHDLSLIGNFKEQDQDKAILVQRARKELADTIIYGDLAIQALGGNTSEELREKFNDKSHELGLPFLV